MGRVVHFEIHADDPERAVLFYTTVFGWTVSRMGDIDYWLLSTGPDGEPGINGAILPRSGERPPLGAPIVGMVTTAQVDDLDAALTKVLELGGDLALDKMKIPGVGTVAYVHDTEANVVGILQPEG
jgi:predicted enzyme related to lactoylglutathione lyase